MILCAHRTPFVAIHDRSTHNPYVNYDPNTHTKIHREHPELCLFLDNTKRIAFCAVFIIYSVDFVRDRVCTSILSYIFQRNANKLDSLYCLNKNNINKRKKYTKTNSGVTQKECRSLSHYLAKAIMNRKKHIFVLL